MTDRNTAYKTDNSNFVEDDPLAELARIVSGQSPVQPAVQEVAPSPADDGMDLEAELMRELGGEPAPEPITEVAAPQIEPASQPAVEMVQADASGLEDDLEAQLSQELLGEPQAEAVQTNSYPDAPAANDSGYVVQESQANLESAEAAPSEMLSNLEQQLQNDLETVDQVTREVEAHTQEVAASNEEPTVVEEIAQTAEEAPQSDDLEQFFQEQFSENSAQEIVTPDPVEPELETPVEARVEDNANFIPQAPVEIVAPVAAVATPQKEIDFGEAFTQKVEDIAAEENVTSENGLDLEQGFADAFADELNIQAGEPEVSSPEPIAASAPSISLDPVEPSFDASHDDILARSEPEFVSTESLDAIAAQEPANGGGGFKLALGALAVALVAGLGVVGWSAFNNNGTTQEALIIKADDTPVKVKPKDPGGKVIANTENKVYETVSGNASDQTKQESLINSTQQPVDISKSAQRLKPGEATSTTTQLGGVAPKRVQTLTIRQDGTIVRNSAPEPIEVAKIETAKVEPVKVETAQPVTVNGIEVIQPVTNIPENAIIINGDGTTSSSVSNEPQIVKPLPIAKTLPVAVNTPKPAPVVVAQPVVTSNAPTQIAAAPRATTPVATVKGWSVQVSSQRSPEAAQKSYANLRKRFSSLLSSREVAVQRANIQGKGTFYRVKIPTRSRNDANSLCSRLKNAGGSCFVTRS